MARRHPGWLLLCLLIELAAAPQTQAYELVIPAFEHRTGPFAVSGIPLWNGFSDYMTLLNERDGGIKGVKIRVVPCETGYNTERGIACYEKVKAEALAVIPGSTAIAYQLIPKGMADHIPIVSPGYGRTSSADGRIFSWVFNFPANYWSGASVIVKYIAEQEKGSLKGRKIGLLYLDNAYGREPIGLLAALAQKHGFKFFRYPAPSPGEDLDGIWAQIDEDHLNWLLLWGYGGMNQTAIAGAIKHRFPMNHFIGNWWASTESDVQGAGMDAGGYLGTALHAPGAVCPVHGDIIKYVYGRGKAVDPGFQPRLGEVLYNRGLVTAMWITEAMAKAMEISGRAELRAADVRNGLEALDIDDERIEALGFEGMLAPLRLSCSNHEGSGRAAIQQWDAEGQRWRLVSRFYEPDRELIDPLLRADAEHYAAENNLPANRCK